VQTLKYPHVLLVIPAKAGMTSKKALALRPQLSS
jgi:hypothetical protein